MKVNLRKPFFPSQSISNVQKKMKDVLDSGQMTLGKNVSLFEKNFAKYLNVKFAVE